jgi:hypothetical protein
MSFGGGVDYEPLAAAYRYAADVAQQMYEEAKKTVSGWTGAGTEAVKQWAGLLGIPGYSAVDPTAVLQQYPGYQWALGQGLKALDASAAARGMGLSGAQLKGITDYAQNLALGKVYQPYLSALQQLSGQGLGAGTFTGQSAIQTGQTVGADVIGAAQAQLAGQLAEQQLAEQTWSDITKGLGALGSIALTGGPLGFGWWGSVPAKAEGGPAEPGQPYVVGERGPEVFVPERPGVVIPNYAVPYSSFGTMAPNYALGRIYSALRNPAFISALNRLALERELFHYSRGLPQLSNYVPPTPFNERPIPLELLPFQGEEEVPLPLPAPRQEQKPEPAPPPAWIMPAQAQPPWAPISREE